MSFGYQQCNFSLEQDDEQIIDSKIKIEFECADSCIDWIECLLQPISGAIFEVGLGFKPYSGLKFVKAFIKTFHPLTTEGSNVGKININSLDSTKNEKLYKEVIKATLELNIIKIEEIWAGYTDISNEWFNMLLQRSGLKNAKFEKGTFFHSDYVKLK